jgi:hypothetical protein
MYIRSLATKIGTTTITLNGGTINITASILCLDVTMCTNGVNFLSMQSGSISVGSFIAMAQISIQVIQLNTRIYAATLSISMGVSFARVGVYGSLTTTSGSNPTFSRLDISSGATFTNLGANITLNGIGISSCNILGTFYQYSGEIRGSSITVSGDGTFVVGPSSTVITSGIAVFGGNMVVNGNQFFSGSIRTSFNGHGGLITISGNLTLMNSLSIDGTSKLVNSGALTIISGSVVGIVNGAGTINVPQGGSLTFSSASVVTNAITTTGTGNLIISASTSFSSPISLTGTGVSTITGGSPIFSSSLVIGSGATLVNSAASIIFNGGVQIMGVFQQNFGTITGSSDISLTGSMTIGPSNGTISNAIRMTSNVLNCSIPSARRFTSFITRVNICATSGNCIQPIVCANCTNGYISCPISCFEIVSTSTLTCSGHGTCSAQDVCSPCFSGWSGNRCQITSCFGIASNDKNVCSGRGVCVAPDVCSSCTGGYYGGQCESPMCFGRTANASSVCNGRGTCISPDTCSGCTGGYGGSQCELPTCFGKLSNSTSVCNGRGACVAPDTCMNCPSGWTGQNCEIPICFGTFANTPSVCSGKGLCLGPDQCSCNCGWSSGNCSFMVCFDTQSNDPNVCSGNGQCTSPNFCGCNPGWNGPKCDLKEDFYCFGWVSTSSEACGGNGKCLSQNQCNCAKNYTGTQCDDWSCNNISVSESNKMICSGTGAYIAPDQCKCSNLMVGINCDQHIIWIVFFVWIPIFFSQLLLFCPIFFIDFLLNSANINQWNPMRKKAWGSKSLSKASKKQSTTLELNPQLGEKANELNQPLLQGEKFI